MFLEKYEHAGHVVAADTLGLLDVLSDRLEQQVLHDLADVDALGIVSTLPALFLERLIDPINHLFVRFLFPDAVAAHYYEVNVVRDVELVGVRIGSDSLLLRRQVVPMLIFEVAYGASKV